MMIFSDKNKSPYRFYSVRAILLFYNDFKIKCPGYLCKFVN